MEHPEHIIPVLEKAKIKYNKNYIEYNDFNSDISINLELKDKARNEIFSYLNEGKTVLLISDEGTPTINDPGSSLINEVYMSGHEIEVLPGPSIMSTAYVHAKYLDNNFDGYGFTYLEYTANPEHLKNMISGIKDSKHAIVTTLVNHIFISNKMSEVFLEVFGNRTVAICQNMSHPTESIIKTDLKNVNQHLRHHLNTIFIYPKTF
jgi:16S rRNA (cytidine1402-2'-O)-methyltransferase